MTRRQVHPGARLVLGIEGGGTRTVALLADESGWPLRRVESGPANLKLLSDAQLVADFRFIARQFPRPAALGIGLAGVRTEADAAPVRKAAGQVWPRVPCHVTDDLETALIAAARQQAAGSSRKKKDRARHVPAFRFQPSAFASVLILSGTGSCCYGTNAKGKTAKVGGRGHLLGDAGSAYQIGLSALRAAVETYGRTNCWPKIGAMVLRSLLLNDPEALIGWAQSASKAEIAALAVDVFAAWERRDKIAARIVRQAAESLAADAVACAERLAKRGAPMRFVLAGGTLLKQPRFAALVRRQLRGLWPRAEVIALKREGAWGAVELARRRLDNPAVADERSSYSGNGFEGSSSSFSSSETHANLRGRGQSPRCRANKVHGDSPDTSGLVAQMTSFVRSVKLSPTEQRNPRSAKLDKLPIAKTVRLMLAEDSRIPRALFKQQRQIQRGVEMVAASLRRGGRLFYVGAGTSGRLGVLDASECPPTFRTPPEQVQAIVAGGQTALSRAVEGAEDDSAAGGRAIQFRRVNARDVIVGIAASGRTPFVWGALVEAKRRRARTILICCNPFLRIARAAKPDLVIAPNVGPEVLTGSTRLKAGTATKLILNMLTTLSMVRLGKVAGNLMADLNPSSAKLRDRAVRMVQTLAGVSYAVARAALEKTGWVVKDAVARLWRKEPCQIA